MFATGFSMATDRIAEPIGGPSAAFLAEQARRARRVGVRVGARAQPDGADARPSTGSCWPAPDGTVHRYDKIHPFTLRRRARALRAPATER